MNLQVRIVEPGRPLKRCRGNHPTLGIYSTDDTFKADDAVLLEGIDTSQIFFITSRTGSIIRSLNNSSCKALAILTGEIDVEELQECKVFSDIKYLDIAGCKITSKDPQRYRQYKYSPISLKTLVSSENYDHLQWPIGLEKYIVHLPKKPSQCRSKSFDFDFCKSVNHFEILGNHLNPNPIKKHKVGIPFDLCLTTFICTATPNQVTCYIDPNQYCYIEKPNGFDMEDDECVINYYNCFANCTKIIVHRGFSWEIRIGSNKTLTVTFDMVTLKEGTVVQYQESSTEVPSNTTNKL